MAKSLTAIYLCAVGLQVTWGWHDISNVDYHCWALSANAQNPDPYKPVCTGISIQWILSPPSTVRVGEKFNTTTELLLDAPFFQWAVTNGFFTQANFSQGITDPVDAKYWCENTICPTPSSATQENCCIHHMNIHSCPLGDTSVSNGLCGPWIPAKGQIITHSEVLVGTSLVGNWTNDVPGLYVTGQTSIISHFKVAGMSVALVYEVFVKPKAECGNDNCEDDVGEDCSVCPKDCGRCPLKPWQLGLIVTAVLMIFVVIGIIYGYFAYQKRKLLYDNSWIYKYENIKTSEQRLLMGSMVSQTDALSMYESGFNSTQVFVTTGDVDGKTVAIRKISKKTFTLTKRIREEVRTVRQLEHPNVCRFIGGCIEVPNVCILMLYCAKGSLNDVLLNEDIPLSWSFRFSFATDISRGMKYLHSHKIIHGRLWSSNCVVDDRWSVKITDYGLETFRKPLESEDEIAKKQHQVYLSPEIKQSITYRHSEQSDVYAFSVILIEIATRGDPYQDNDPSSVPSDWQPSLPTFEKISDDDSCPCPEEFCKLISATRVHNPMERLSFDGIKRRLQRMNPNKQNPVDLIITMMEKYSKHLEAIVAERTQDLLVEKHRTETLLYSMLPKSVADSLKTGTTVQAESFDHCTIYFSDIVGFTVLCSKSTAFQVVGLLNNLYTVFDEIIENYIVYKVETIGDAYMVVSGLPKRIPNHASEIAQMSLKIVDAAKTFKIPHIPNEALKIRIGLHSGYVCAGVVGRTMPRYCLFGDTVNTASRMESNGEAYRVHISNATYTELLLQGGFDCEERGVLNVKSSNSGQTVMKEIRKVRKNQSLCDDFKFLTHTLRIIALVIASLIYIYRQQTQIEINKLWYFLLSSPVYNSVYFETLFTVTCYAIVIPIYPFALFYIKSLDKFKIDPSVTYKDMSVLTYLWNAVVYMAPFATLDTVMVKKYVGVPQEILDEKRMNWIQTFRALPDMPPTLFKLVFDLIASIILFDLIFFFIHLTLHRNMWLYTTLHRRHHNHDVLHAHVTDQLTIVERVILVLSANFSLKWFDSHPLTRTLFIPVFVFLLVDNHTGYDLPFGIHRIVPFGIYSGPVNHYKHHVNGERNYQPFLNYLDYIFIKSK